MAADTGTAYGLDTERISLGYYLRALWNDEFPLRACDKPLTQQRPFLSELGIHLPRQFHSHRGVLLRDLYRAAAAHAAAHLTHSNFRFERGTLKPVQTAIISLLEDARVEQLAISEMPGLRSLWLQFFDPRGCEGSSAEALLLRLSHALLDPNRRDDNPWVMKACRLFHESQQAGSNPLALREVGSRLGNDLGQMRAQFNARSYVVEPLYRDDNLFLWIAEQPPEETHIEDSGAVHDDQAPESSERFDERGSEDARYRPVETSLSSADSVDDRDAALLTYPEWDARTGRYRERWCRIVERQPEASDPSSLQAQVAAHAALSRRLAQLLQARKLGQMQRLRRQADGEEFEPDALVRAISELRRGQMPDLRLYRRTRRQKPDLSVLLLLDLSASTHTLTSDGHTTLLSLIRAASVLLGQAIEQVGDQFAMHGFRSNGRHEIEYLRFKEFGEAMNDAVLARLAGTSGALSTRMGAAIRHATRQMQQCRTAQRLILVLTDGEPHDIDVFDPVYLVQDAARAVQRSTLGGTPVFCVSVDRAADSYLQKIFAPHHYQVIDSVSQLPQRLPELYLRLTA